ncbi:MAG: dual specificity protein phosphatase family protein [Aureliella sp.]
MIREIHDGILYLGNAMDVRDLRLLYDNQLVAVVDLAVNERPAQLSHDLIYLRIPIVDGNSNWSSSIELAIRCLIMLMNKRLKTVVACSAGMSRSPAIAAAAIAALTRRPIEECLLEIVANAPHDVSPTLWSQVRAVYQKII